MVIDKKFVFLHIKTTNTHDKESICNPFVIDDYRRTS